MEKTPTAVSTRRPIIVGHRGSPEDAPENTLASFRESLRRGAQMVELDVRLSRAGVPVVIHDSTARRVTAGASSSRVSASSLKHLKKLDAGARFEAYRGETIPTLEEVLQELCPLVPVNVELKFSQPHHRPLCLAVAEILKRLGVTRRVLVSSFYHGSLGIMRRLIPELVVARLFGNWTGPPYLEDIEEICQEPLMDATPELPFRGRTIVIYHKMADHELVRRFHEHDGQVLVYTVDHPADMQRMLDIGVDAIITNRPGVLREFLAEVAG